MSFKLPNTGTTIFSAITALANQTGAVNLSQGFPDFNPDPALINAVGKALSEDHHQYAPMPGVMELRTVVAKKYQHFFGIDVDGDREVTITPGGTAALFSAIASVVGVGDEVLIFDPAYDSYAPSVEIVGGTIVRSALKLPDYTPDWDHVRSIVSANTKLIIINTPHNPSGTLWSTEDLDILASLCDELQCYVLSDEVYDVITFGTAHRSVLSIPTLRNRCFVVNSFGKLVHATGWKVGACIACPELTAEFRKLHQYINFSVNTPMQVGLADYLESMKPIETLAPFLQNKRDYFVSLFEGSPWKIRLCHGTYFQLLDYSAFWDGRDMELVDLLIRKFKVACIPLSPFCGGDVSDTAVRLCFAKQQPVLELAALRLAEAAETLLSQR